MAPVKAVSLHVMQRDVLLGFSPYTGSQKSRFTSLHESQEKTRIE